jgi:predicted PurR-regulated permease PerM
MPFSLTTEQKQTTFWLALWLAFAALLYLLGPVLTPFIIAAILAYGLNGPVDRLCAVRMRRWTMPRALAVVVVMLLFIAVFGALALTVVPVLEKEVPLLVAQIPAFLAKLDAVLGPRLAQLGVHAKLDGGGIRDMLSQQVASGGGGDVWTRVLASARVGGSALLGWAATVALVPVVLFYLLLDWHHMLAQAQGAIPRRWVGRVVAMAQEVDALLGQYLRGQLLVMFVLAVYYSAALGAAGFDVALPVGIVTGLLVFIPYLGFGLGLALALIAAVLQFEGLSGLVYVAVIYGAGQVIEGFFLTPRLVGERIGLNPLAVIFALLAFGQLFGFAGVLLALPASAVLMVAFRHLRRHYLSSTFYNA